jgi:hypothetical protein
MLMICLKTGGTVNWIPGALTIAVITLSVSSANSELIDLSSCAHLQEAMRPFSGRETLSPQETATKEKLAAWIAREGCKSKEPKENNANAGRQGRSFRDDSGAGIPAFTAAPAWDRAKER